MSSSINSDRLKKVLSTIKELTDSNIIGLLHNTDYLDDDVLDLIYKEAEARSLPNIFAEHSRE